MLSCLAMQVVVCSLLFKLWVKSYLFSGSRFLISWPHHTWMNTKSQVHFKPTTLTIEWIKWNKQKLTISSVFEGLEQPDLPSTTSRNIKWYGHFWKHFDSFTIVKNTLTVFYLFMCSQEKWKHMILIRLECKCLFVIGTCVSNPDVSSQGDK